MNCIKNFIENYRQDIVALCIVITVLAGICIIKWGWFGSLFVDCGREAYLPELILDGKILFKDIFAMYAPLPYQINACVYKIFGGSFNVLQGIGVSIVFLAVLCLYRICRFFINSFYSAAICIILISQFFTINTHCMNYIFPYAYAMTYAVLFFLASAMFTMYFIDKNKPLYSYLASLTLGASLACKPEFTLCYLAFLTALVYKRINFKTILFNILFYMLPSILSWGILFLQGLSITDFQNYMSFLNNFFATEEQQFFQNICFQNPLKFYVLAKYLEAFSFIFLYSALHVFLLTMYDRYNNKLTRQIQKKILFLFLGLILCAINFQFGVIVWEHFQLKLFSWICFALFPLSAYLIYKLKKQFDNTTFMLLILSLFGILACYRLKFNLLAAYSLYIVSLPAAVIFIYFISTVKNNIVKKSVIIFLILASFFNTLHLYKLYRRGKVPITTSKGILYASKYETNTLQTALNYIYKNTKEDNTVLMLPEGCIINFITKRPTNTKLYHLIPNHIAALGESNVVQEFQTNPPDFIMLNNVNYGMYGKPFICKDFGLNICKFIYENYQLAESTQNLKIYKRKMLKN